MSKLISLFMHDEAKQTEKGNLLNSEARTRVRVRLRERESAVQQSECTSESESRESERPPLPLPLPVSSELRAQSQQPSKITQSHSSSQAEAWFNKIAQSHVGMVLSTCCNKCRADPPTDAYTGPVDFLRPKPRPQYIDPAMVRLVVRGLRALAPIPSSSLPDEPISWLSP